MRIEGVYTAMITPFCDDYSLDEEGLRCNLRFQVAGGIHGILLLGTTGEAPTLSQREKERIVEIACEEVEGRVPIMIGTGTNATATTVEQTLWAEKRGADSALVVTPYYNKPTPEGLYRHFAEIAERSSLPLCLYNIPGRTGTALSLSTLQRLMAISSIVAIKEASNSLSMVEDILYFIERERLSLLAGDDAWTVPLMALGGEGVISVASNLFPREMVALFDLMRGGNFEEARRLHFRLLPLFRAFFLETNPIPIKTAMGRMGYAAGPCRLPLVAMEKENQERLLAALSGSQLFV